MKLELVDFAVAFMAVIMLLSYAAMQNAAFLYVFAVLVIVEILGIFLEIRKRSGAVKETESLP